MEDPLLGRQIGSCEVLSPLAEGTTGRIYVAQNQERGERVALKILDHRLVGSERGLTRFRREAQAAAKVEHPNVARILNLGEHEGIHFIEQELIDGEPLKARLEREERLPIEEVIRIGACLASALGALHEAEVVHRDLKPDNVVLTPEGVPKIIDFSLCLDLADQGPRATAAGAMVGTPLYMAPEQVEAQSEIGPATDVFALGALLYRLLAGHVPHERPDDQDAWSLLRRRSSEPPAAVRESRPETPPELAQLIMNMLAQAPEDRPSAAQVHAAFQAPEGVALEALSGAGAQPQPTVSAPGATAKTPSRVATQAAAPQATGSFTMPEDEPRPILGLVGILVLVLAIVLGAWALKGGGADEPGGLAQSSDPVRLDLERALNDLRQLRLEGRAEHLRRVGTSADGVWAEEVAGASALAELLERLNRPDRLPPQLLLDPIVFAKAPRSRGILERFRSEQVKSYLAARRALDHQDGRALRRAMQALPSEGTELRFLKPERQAELSTLHALAQVSELEEGGLVEEAQLELGALLAGGTFSSPLGERARSWALRWRDELER